MFFTCIAKITFLFLELYESMKNIFLIDIQLIISDLFVYYNFKNK